MSRSLDICLIFPVLSNHSCGICINSSVTHFQIGVWRKENTERLCGKRVEPPLCDFEEVAHCKSVTDCCNSVQCTVDAKIPIYLVLQSRIELSFLESDIHGNRCGFERLVQCYVIRVECQSIKLDPTVRKIVIHLECNGHAHTLKYTNTNRQYLKYYTIETL